MYTLMADLFNKLKSDELKQFFFLAILGPSKDFYCELTHHTGCSFHFLSEYKPEWTKLVCLWLKTLLCWLWFWLVMHLFVIVCCVFIDRVLAFWTIFFCPSMQHQNPFGRWWVWFFITRRNGSDLWCFSPHIGLLLYGTSRSICEFLKLVDGRFRQWENSFSLIGYLHT